jgi:hypothetical protein
MNDGPIFYPSTPYEIRDGTIARVKAMTANFKNVYRQRTFPTKDAQMPLAAVWTVRDNASPNGDCNAGSPSFLHSFTLAIDIAAAAANDDALDATITSMAEGVRDTLLTDASWVMLFEGIQRCNLHYSYPKETDFIIAMATIEIEVTFRSDWPPIEANDFTQVAVSTSESGTSPPRRYDGYLTQFSVPGPAT